jgi:hypothetical protein
MNTFDNPLNNIKITSPCPADWNQMMGDERKRYCGDCKLNVYNLSGMTQAEAKNLLINSEGRLCVRFFRRSDGTVLMKDCPVGWQLFKKRISKTATTVFSLIAGIFGGLFAFSSITNETSTTMGATVEIQPHGNVDELYVPTSVVAIVNKPLNKVNTEVRDGVLTEYVGFDIVTLDELSPKKNKLNNPNKLLRVTSKKRR